MKNEEYFIHTSTVQYIKANSIKYPSLKLWYHPANGEYRDYKTAIRLSNMGVNKGVPDLMHPGQLINGVLRGYSIEIKKPGGEQSPEQKWWEFELKKLNYIFLISFSELEIKTWLKYHFMRQ